MRHKPTPRQHDEQGSPLQSLGNLFDSWAQSLGNALFGPVGKPPSIHDIMIALEL